MISTMSNQPQTTLNPAPATPPAGIAEITPAQAQQWLNNGEAVLIDVRETDEHTREHIRGAQLLPLSRFAAGQAAAFAKPGQKIVFHCKGGKRSADACRLAVSLAGPGRSIYSLTGGIEGWKSAGLPVEVNTSVSGISVMRQVQLVIGLAVLTGSALAWFVHPGFIGIPAFFGAGLTFAGASGTCALATIMGKMPWNRAACGASCASGGCV